MFHKIMKTGFPPSTMKNVTEELNLSVYERVAIRIAAKDSLVSEIIVVDDGTGDAFLKTARTITVNSM